jgi:hypothetical protein
LCTKRFTNKSRGTRLRGEASSRTLKRSYTRFSTHIHCHCRSFITGKAATIAGEVFEFSLFFRSSCLIPRQLPCLRVGAFSSNCSQNSCTANSLLYYILMSSFGFSKSLDQLFGNGANFSVSDLLHV